MQWVAQMAEKGPHERAAVKGGYFLSLHLAGPNEMHPKEQTLCDIVRTYKTADALVRIFSLVNCLLLRPTTQVWPHSSFVRVKILTELGQVYITPLQALVFLSVKWE